jgi:hypothetical protein
MGRETRSIRMIAQGTFINFSQVDNRVAGRPQPLTKEWWITTKQGGFLGKVEWFGPWRKYNFYPAEDSGFEQVCLREIATFIEDRTREHKIGLRPAARAGDGIPNATAVARPNSSEA